MDKNELLEEVWNRLHVRLCRFICSRIPVEEDAEDILQEVFVRIHTHLETIQSLDRLEGWIYQVARNEIIDYYRRRKTVAGLPEIAVEDEYDEGNVHAELSPAVRELVETLPEPYRQAILLTEYEGLNQRELAGRLGISISGAKSRVQRAREQMRDALLSCCHFEFDVRGTLFEVRERCCCCEV